MALAKPPKVKKPELPKQPVVQAVVPQGAGKGVEVQVRNPNTGGSEFVKPKDLPPEQARPVFLKEKQRVQELAQQEAQAFLQGKQENAINPVSNDFNARSGQGGTIPLPQPENANLSNIPIGINQENASQQRPQPPQSLAQVLEGSSSPVVSGVGQLLGKGGELLGIPKPQTEEATPEQITKAVTSAVSAGLTVATGQALTKWIGAKLAVNALPQAANVGKAFAPAAAGKAANNIKTVSAIAKLARNFKTVALIPITIASLSYAYDNFTSKFSNDAVLSKDFSESEQAYNEYDKLMRDAVDSNDFEAALQYRANLQAMIIGSESLANQMGKKVKSRSNIVINLMKEKARIYDLEFERKRNDALRRSTLSPEALQIVQEAEKQRGVK